MELQPTDFTDGVVAHRFHRSNCRGTPTLPSVSICGICGSSKSVERWNCSPPISRMELWPTDFTDRTAGGPPPCLLCRSVESVGAVSLWTDGTAAHRFHGWSCGPQISPIELQGDPHPAFCVDLWSLWEL